MYCKKAKDFFRRNNVSCEEKDISVDDNAREQMIEKSGQLGVPVIEINDKIVIGFDETAIKELLKL